MIPQTIKNGIYPTMITPYTKDNRLDEDALRQLVGWYSKNGCHGIFAACQSSELFYLTREERRKMVEIVREEVLRIAAQSGSEPMTVVASGHVSSSIDEQTEELLEMHEAGADAVILITNRLDIDNSGESKWLKDLEQLIRRLPEDVNLGIYECPTPYKRLLSNTMLNEIKNTGRFSFFKDTCCRPELLQERISLLKGSGIKLFNANAQTFLSSLKDGGSGYCGIMANFHPELYVWLYENYENFPKKAEVLETVLSMSAFSEALAYPITAKYYLREFENMRMEIFSRSCPMQHFGEYDMLVMKQLKELNVLLDNKLSVK